MRGQAGSARVGSGGGPKGICRCEMGMWRCEFEKDVDAEGAAGCTSASMHMVRRFFFRWQERCVFLVSHVNLGWVLLSKLGDSSLDAH